MWEGVSGDSCAPGRQRDHTRFLQVGGLGGLRRKTKQDIKKKVNYQTLAETKLGISNSSKLIPFTNELMWLINDVAKMYYPDSKNPIFELTIEELFLLSMDVELYQKIFFCIY